MKRRHFHSAVGNRQRVTDNGQITGYTANHLNQYTVVDGSTLSYDANGNLSNTVDGVLGDWTYTYDAQNRLIRAVGGSSSSIVAEFYYDARNRCVKRVINGVTTCLIYDGWSLLEERNLAGNLLARYYHGPVIDELLCRVTETNTVYYHHDGLGSTNTGLNPLTLVVSEPYTNLVANFAPTLTTNGTPYLWYVGWGVTEGFEGQDAGDVDGDGWTGRLEYLWGSNPVGGKECPRMTVEWEGGSNAVRVVLAGVAPRNRDSGQWRAQRTIGGGRWWVRVMLYMVALVASRHNEKLRGVYERLVRAGKAPKVALVALMRRLISVFNQRLKNLQFQPA